MRSGRRWNHPRRRGASADELGTLRADVGCVTDDYIRDTILIRLAEVAPETAESAIDPHADLCRELRLDDSEFWAYVSAIGSELGVDIPEGDFPRLRTIEGGVGYVSARLSK